MLENIRRRLESHPQWTLALVTVAVLMPFLSKPFNIDDPLFIWTAHQIQAHPADPYGFKVYWDWEPAPMWQATDNPPFTCYYIAFMAALLGWSEMALHTAFVPVVLAVVLGTFRLARYFCESPITAALATLFTPALLVSSTTVMCDVLLLAFWIWAVVLWVEGTDQNNFYKLFAAGCLVGLAEITKYSGICLVPLLAAYSIAARKRVGLWAQFLMIPLAVLWAYQLAMQRLYDYYPLFGVSHFSLSRKDSGSSFVSPCFVGLAFTGGCLATVLFFTPLLWKKRFAAPLVFAALSVCAVYFDSRLFEKYQTLQNHIFAQVQLALWAATGISALGLAARDFLAARNAKALLLILWVAGTFIFAAFINWTVNARSILPMAPAVGILIVRQIERNFRGAPFPIDKTAVCLGLSATLAFYVTVADYQTAAAMRQTVRSIHAAAGDAIKEIRFQGHWAFEYYMDQLGAEPLDLKNSKLKPGDVIAIPSDNDRLLAPKSGTFDLMATFSEPGPRWVTTINDVPGAGFYASVRGPLPFAFGPVPAEKVYICHLR